MAVAGGRVWVPLKQGNLHGLDPSGGLGCVVPLVGERPRKPAFFGGRLYIASPRSGITIVDVGRCEVRKRVPLRRLKSPAVVWNGQIAVGDKRGKLYLLNPRGGEVVTSLPLGFQIEYLVEDSVGRRLVAAGGGANGGFVAVIDRKGTTRVVRLLDGQVLSTEAGPDKLHDTVVGAPLVHENVVIVPVEFGGEKKGAIYFLDPVNLTPVSRPLEVSGNPTAPVAHLGFVFFGDDAGNVYAVDVSSGELLWKEPLGSPIEQPVAVSDTDSIFVVDGSGTVWSAPIYGRTGWEKMVPMLLEKGHWKQAIELLRTHGESERAMEIAKEHSRWDIAASIAREEEYYDEAAEYCEEMAGLLWKKGRTEEAAEWYHRAEKMWLKSGAPEKASAARRKAAEARGEPLLELELLNRPTIYRGAMGELQFELRNEGFGDAREIEVSVFGMVMERAAYNVSGAIKPKATPRRFSVRIEPTRAGKPDIKVRARYKFRGRWISFEKALPIRVDERKGNAIQIGGDAVIVMRGMEFEGLSMDVKGDAVVTGRRSFKQRQKLCPVCGTPVQEDWAVCPNCGAQLR